MEGIIKRELKNTAHQLEESSLLFTFSDAWNIRSFDDHRYYRWLSGLGFRGVDFVGIYQNKLVLIEVKNYRRREGMSRADAFQAVRNAPAAFALKMVEKVEDSLRIVRAVNSSYQRRWWFPLFLRLPDGLKRWYPQSYFWHTASKLAANPANCVFVLWLDADSDTIKVEKEIIETLMNNLTDKTHQITLAGQKNNPFATDVRVQDIWED